MGIITEKELRWSELVDEVRAERLRQDQKWGEQAFVPEVWLSILIEEVGEVARVINEGRLTMKDGWPVKEVQIEDYREEMVQVAAVALAAVESLDRGCLRRADDDVS